MNQKLGSRPSSPLNAPISAIRAPKRTLISTNVANKSILPQQKAKDGSLQTVRPAARKNEILAGLVGNGSTCCKIRGSHGCIPGIFIDTVSMEPNYELAAAFVLGCREVTRTKNDDEQTLFIRSIFNSASSGKTTLSNGTEKFLDMNYRLPMDPSVNKDAYNGTEEGHKVCRYGLSFAYGFSPKRLSALAASLKESDTGQVSTTTIHEWKEGHIHQGYTLLQSEEVFKKHMDTPGKSTI
jgi:hypothetical protein